MATAGGPRVKSPFECCSRTQSFSHMQPGPHCSRVAFPLGRYAGPIHRHSQGCQGQLAGACTAESNLFISSAWDYRDRTPCGSLCLKMSESMTLTPLLSFLCRKGRDSSQRACHPPSHQSIYFKTANLHTNYQ